MFIRLSLNASELELVSRLRVTHSKQQPIFSAGNSTTQVQHNGTRNSEVV